MLPWLIGAAVLGVGAAILSSSKDDSDNSSSSSSNYKDKEREAKERERQAAIKNSQQLIDQKFYAIKNQWRIEDTKHNRFMKSKYNSSAETDSGPCSFVVPQTICEQEEKFISLQTELEQLNIMFAEVNDALNSARSSLQNDDYSEEIPTVDASTVDIQIVKDHPFKSSHTSSHTIKVNDKRAARNPFDVTGSQVRQRLIFYCEQTKSTSQFAHMPSEGMEFTQKRWHFILFCCLDLISVNALQLNSLASFSC